MCGVLQNRCQNVVVDRRVAIWGSVRRPGKEQPRRQTAPGAKPPESYRAGTAPRSDRPPRSHYFGLLVVARFYPLPSRDFSDVCSICKNRRNLLFSPCNLQAENKSFATPVSNAVSVVSCAPVLARPVVTVRAHHPQESLSMCKSLLFSFQCLPCPTREIVACHGRLAGGDW